MRSGDLPLDGLWLVPLLTALEWQRETGQSCILYISDLSFMFKIRIETGRSIMENQTRVGQNSIPFLASLEMIIFDGKDPTRENTHRTKFPLELSLTAITPVNHKP